MSKGVRGAAKRLGYALLLLAVTAALACRRPADESEGAPAAEPPSVAEPVTTAAASNATATAVLRSHADHQISGTVRFEQSAGAVMVSAELSGLPPGEHGFHIHEVGDCSDPLFENAGSHFNPGGQPHGDPAVEPHHAGDLGNLTATEQGAASFSLRRTELAMDPGELSILGRAVIVHRDPDTFVQPDGAAGPRIACGVIERSP